MVIESLLVTTARILYVVLYVVWLSKFIGDDIPEKIYLGYLGRHFCSAPARYETAHTTLIWILGCSDRIRPKS